MQNLLKKFGIWILVIVLLLAAGYFLNKRYNQPLPGQVVSDLGREHIPDGEKFDYNSNPPTSGKHYGEWTRKGVYDKPVSDGHLVHSLEHGYVTISYNCTKLVASHWSLVVGVNAHEETLTATQSAEKVSSPSAGLEGEEWNSQNCKDLVAKLTSVYEKKGKTKLIVIPRPSLDVTIALTAWSRIDKFNDFDEKRIIEFIDAYRDHGPEKTMEQ